MHTTTIASGADAIKFMTIAMAEARGSEKISDIVSAANAPAGQSVSGRWVAERSFCPACGRPDVTVGLDSVLYETHPTFRAHACGVGGPGSGEIECQHDWLDRPESDTRECLTCGTEVAG